MNDTIVVTESISMGVYTPLLTLSVSESIEVLDSASASNQRYSNNYTIRYGNNNF